MKKLILSIVLFSYISVFTAPDTKGFSKESYMIYFSLTSSLVPGVKATVALFDKRINLFAINALGAFILGYIGHHVGYDIGSVVENAKRNNKKS